MLDPMIQMILSGMAALPRMDPNTLTAEAAREAFKAYRLPLPKQNVAQVRDVRVAVAGGDIAARLYTPHLGAALPCLVYFHGGGWVVGDIESHDPLARALANSAACAVLSVDYRLAPEHPFPGPVEDCFAAVQWAAAHAGDLGIDATRLAVGGDSAGGNLAAAVALKTRDSGGVALRHQLLIYPVTDSGLGTPSYQALADGYLLTRAMMGWYWDQYCATQADKANPLAAPLLAASLAGLPSASVVTAAYDPLRDEGDHYARRLEEAGVTVAHHCEAGMIHGFMSMVGMVPQAQTAVDFMCAALKRDFA